jgi:hypothetical protein
MITATLATAAAGLFAGAAVYINLVEQPARLSCGIAPAVTQWAPSYRRATLMQAPLAAGGSALAFAAWWLGGGAAWALGGVLLLAVVPFTLLVIMPTNTRLLSDRLDRSSPEAEHLLRRWGHLHAVRSGLSVAAFVVFLLAR